MVKLKLAFFGSNNIISGHKNIQYYYVEITPKMKVKNEKSKVKNEK